MGYRLQRALTSRTAYDIARDVVQPPLGTSGDAEANASRAVRRAQQVLADLGFVTILPERGRGRTNIYLLHRVEPSFPVPNGLWRNGWLGALEGPELLLLLTLLAHRDSSRAKIGAAMRDVVMRDGGSMMVSASLAELHPFSENVRRDAVSKLESLGLLSRAQARARGTNRPRRSFALLNPDLLGRPPGTVDRRAR